MMILPQSGSGQIDSTVFGSPLVMLFVGTPL